MNIKRGYLKVIVSIGNESNINRIVPLSYFNDDH